MKKYDFCEIVEQLNGQYVNFYGVDGNCFKLGNVVFEAIEDENDGYRSMLDAVEVVEKDCIFSGTPLTAVNVLSVEEKSDYNDDYFVPFCGYRFIDNEGYTWLKIGTSSYDDYYPMFTFEYTPPKSGISALIDEIMER